LYTTSQTKILSLDDDVFFSLGISEVVRSEHEIKKVRNGIKLMYNHPFFAQTKVTYSESSSFF